jgi:hypothetical protein
MDSAFHEKSYPFFIFMQNGSIVSWPEKENYFVFVVFVQKNEGNDKYIKFPVTVTGLRAYIFFQLKMGYDNDTVI